MLSARYRITRLSVIACVLYLEAESLDCDVNFRPTDYLRCALCHRYARNIPRNRGGGEMLIVGVSWRRDGGDANVQHRMRTPRSRFALFSSSQAQYMCIGQTVSMKSL